MSATEVVDNGAAVFDEADHPPTSKSKVLSERTEDEDNHYLNSVEVEEDAIVEFDTSEVPLEKLPGDAETVSAISEDSAAVEAPTDDEIPLKDPTDPLVTLRVSDSPLQLFESPNTAPHNEFEVTEPVSQKEDEEVDSTGTETIASEMGRVHEGEEPQLEVEQVLQEPVFHDADAAPEAETLAQNLPEDTAKPINGNPVNLEPDGPRAGVAALQTSSSVDSAASVDAAEETVLETGIAEEEEEEANEERATKSSFTEEGAEDPISNVHTSISVIPDTVSSEAAGGMGIVISHVNDLAVSTSSEETPHSVTPVLTDPIIGGEESTVGNIVTDGSSGEVQVHLTEEIEFEKHMHLGSNVREDDLISAAELAESHSNELGSSAVILVGEKPGADASIVLGHQENLEDNAEGSHAIPVEALTIVSAAALQHSVSPPLVEPTQIETGQLSLTLENSEDIPTGQALSGNVHNESSLEEMPMNVSEALEPLVERSTGDAAIETESLSKLEHESELIITDEFAGMDGQSKLEIVPALEESSVTPDKISETAYELLADESEAELVTESDVLGVILATGNVDTVSADPNAETLPISDEEASSVILNDGEKSAANNESTNTSSVEDVPVARDEAVGPLVEGLPSNEYPVIKDERSKPESVLDTEQSDVKPDEKGPDIGFDNNLDVADTVVDSAASATQSLETETEQHLMTETGGIVVTNEDADPATVADVEVAPASGKVGGEGPQVFSELVEEPSHSDTTVEGTIADDEALPNKESIADFAQDEPVDLFRENSGALVEEFSTTDPASLIGSVVKDHSTDTVVQFLSSGEAVSDASINQFTETEQRPVLEPHIQANQRAEVPQDEAADDSEAPTNEVVPAAAPEVPFAEDIVPPITATVDSQDEFSSHTLGLEKPSLDHEIQLTELTTPSESAQIDVEKLVEVTPDSPNVGTAPEDSSDLRVHVTEVERSESPWTPSYSVSNQDPDVTREEDISEIEQLPISDVVTSAESSVPMVNIVSEEFEPTDANPEERKEPSRPSSPWVPSYSVSVQGSPSISAHNSPIIPGLDFPNEESPAHPAESSVDELVPGTEEPPTKLDIEIAPSVYQDVPGIITAIPSAGLDQLPEVPSEVHLEITENPQEPVSMIISDEEVPIGVPVADFSLQGKLDTEDVPATVNIENGEGEHKNEDTTEPADVVNAVGAEEIHSEIGAEDSMNLSTNTTEIDRPKSPWTPSYSVINQGPDMAREEDIPEIQQLPPFSVPADQELPVPEVNIIPEVSEATVANPEEPKESSRPSSPWVPSYSVSVQGSPSVSAHSSPVLAATELPENVIPVIELSEESVSAEVSTLNDAAKSIEEPSLEVDSLPSEPPVDSVIHEENSVIPSVNITEPSSEISLDIPRESTEADIAQNPMQDQMVNTVSSVEEPLVVDEMLDQSGNEDTAVFEVPDEEAIVDLSAKPYKDVEIPEALSPSQSVVAAQIERPKSPWGSYEVTNQSGHETSVAEMTDPEVVEAVEAIPTPTSFIKDEPVLELADEPALKDKSTTEDAPAAEVSQLTVDTTENDHPERPKSPWTPSYSVSRQGSQVFNEARNDAELDTSEQPPLHTESSTNAPITLEEPSVSDVIEESVSAPSGETFPVSSVPGDIDHDTVGDTLAAPKDRGWFSKPPTGRTSLDNAQGVITSPKAISPVEGRSSVELLGGSSASGSATADITNEGPDEDHEKKGKWCVIM
ncbi:hypothetical protein EV368DRAFT_61937 [Lentinula lateritia]|uniref:Uncharacterized protein n=1 Tax=Lentinula aff. lateritia TaxID=2804960 RepID=A0ACC1UEB6_9AGAR|nr:hypothetical protein F5876DRAFT_61767 [Lentinula aff. lateritia]KAJ3856114.1 hypothetical protein EV368DRAFT_61937 [Lentinula lateritia]